MKVFVSQMVPVDLDSNAVQEVFNRRLEELCGGEHVYIDDDTGKVLEWTDTGHGSGMTDEVKGASKIQIAALKFREAAREIARAEASVREAASKGKRGRTR